MSANRTITVVLCVAVLVLAGCPSQTKIDSGSPNGGEAVDTAGGSTGSPTASTVQDESFAIGSEQREMNPAVSEEELSQLVSGNTQFAFELYRWLIQSNDNLIISPYSISTALAMTYAGASGQTKTDMANVLHFTLPDDKLHAAFNKIDLTLNALGNKPAGEEGQPLKLSVANSLWVQKDIPLNPPFLDVVTLNYGAGVGQVDFWGDPGGAAKTVNDWISGKTGGKIKDALDPGSLNPGETMLLLVDAIYFLANWELQFDKEATTDGPFHLLAGRDVTVPMMTKTDQFRYFKGDGFAAASLGYVGGDTSMVIMLPDEGEFEEFEGKLDGALVSNVLGNLEMKSVDLTMPKFKYESSLVLAKTLRPMGMESAFQGGFDNMFVGPLGESPFIDEVIHKAFVAVDEAGTEAAAVTIVEIRVLAAPFEPEQPIEFRVDRPFVFLIVEESTKSVLFIGRVLDPS